MCQIYWYTKYPLVLYKSQEVIVDEFSNIYYCLLLLEYSCYFDMCYYIIVKCVTDQCCSILVEKDPNGLLF